MEPNQATHYSQRIEHVLAACLPTEDRAPARLHEAMRYGALSPGKRVRPRLVYATATALGVPLAPVLALPGGQLSRHWRSLSR